VAWRRAAPVLSPPLRAALLMLLANVCVAGMTATIRVASHELHPFEIAFFRNLFGFVFVLPFLWRAGLGMLRAHAPGRLLVSSAGHLAAMLCYFLAVAYMPLAELTALSFTKPLFATVGAAFVLHEVVRGRRWGAIATGFLGVMIVLRPGAEAFSPYAGLVLLSAVASAAVVLMIKQMTLRDGSTTIVLYQTLFLTALSLPPALWFWRTPGLESVALVALIGALGTIAWLCFTRAFALADASAVMPYEFLKLPITAALAYLMFAEVPSVWTWLGGAVIFGASIYIAHREAKVARMRAAAEPAVLPPLRPGA
jgi:drug/metabolite transporter (DMT)-like permease